MLADGRGRFAVRLGVVVVLLAAAGVASLLAGGPRAVRAATTTATTPVVTSPAASVLVLRGHGWGHGLGLSQWGAYGYAKHGWTYDRILGHYYSGTTLGPAPVTTVRVLLAAAKKTMLESTAPWTVADAAGTKVQLDPGALVLKAKLAITGHPELQPPFTFTAKQPLIVDSVPYRGRIAVSSDGKLVQVIDTLGLEAYVKGVVPAEMPSSWSAEALK